MGWLFRHGINRKRLIEERTRDWERTREDCLTVTTRCLASYYRGGAFSGVLWAVWDRTFIREGIEVEPRQRWISFDLLRHERDSGWGYKDIDESMGPHYYSCPISYLELVPLDVYGGNLSWRGQVHQYHTRLREKRRQRRLSLSQ